MRHEYSAGAVVYCKIDGVPHYVIIQEASGYWGLPKGHIEAGENDKEAALREILEETGIQGKLVPGPAEHVHYYIGKNIVKHVVYFLVSYENQEVHYHEGELRNAKLLPFEEAMKQLTYRSVKVILKKVHAYLTKQ